MNITEIKTAINSSTKIEENEWQDFEQYFTIRTCKKGEILWNSGEVCKHVVFINRGLIRMYYFLETEKKEVTGQFFFENKFLTDYFSFISQKPSFLIYEALEETEMISIPRVAIYGMYDKYKSFERFGRLIAEQNFLMLQETHMNNKSINPEDKYLKLLKERPKVMARVPLNMIASYLSITPEHLSRIRKKIVTA